MTVSSLFRRPDDLDLESGARGERIVARIRLWIVILLAPIPLLNTIENPGSAPCRPQRVKRAN